MNFLSFCPLCGSENLEKFYEGIDKYYSGKFIQCSVCKNCSLIFLNPRLNDEEYAQWYKQVFQDKRRNFTSVSQVVRSIEENNKYDRKLKQLKYFENYINKNSKCLEIGAGWGTLAKAVKDRFKCEIDVIEPSNLASEVCREHFNLNTYNQIFESFIEKEEERNKYNFIYSYHVFEHIAEPNKFLREIKNILKTDGVLLLALPNTARPEIESEKLFHIEHCFYYTPMTATMILNKNGFQIDNIFLDKNDMKIACYKQKFNNNTSFNNSNEWKKVKNAIAFTDFKFSFLRRIKKMLFYFLSKKQQNKVNIYITKILRR